VQSLAEGGVAAGVPAVRQGSDSVIRGGDGSGRKMRTAAQMVYEAAGRRWNLSRLRYGMGMTDIHRY